MQFTKLNWTLAVLMGRLAQTGLAISNSTYTNPIIPGWHSDPSCSFVEELDSTTFCVSSSFLTFPGLPIYASKDLINWKFTSNGYNRVSQYPNLGSWHNNQGEGIWAPTLRYHAGIFYLVVGIVEGTSPQRTHNLIFNTTDPYSDIAWSDPIEVNMHGVTATDPDLFFDEDGTIYMSSAWGKIYQQSINVRTGNSSIPTVIWAGAGERNPEGPHVYRVGKTYYLVIAQGGTGQQHSVAIARSTNASGPWETHPNNPILTNRNNNKLFQAVGHADIFKDANDNWWGVALAKRSGPDYKLYPMGRETVLFPITWQEDDWPIFGAVDGEMTGPLPAKNLNITGTGSFINDAESVDFGPGTEIPRSWAYWRFPDIDSYAVLPGNGKGMLRLSPSNANLTGFSTADPITFVGRRQTASLFTFEVDIEFEPTEIGQEAGITVFLTQLQHIDFALIKAEVGFVLRLMAVAPGKPNITVPEPVTFPVPRSWYGDRIGLRVEAKDVQNYTFTAINVRTYPSQKELGVISSEIVSGGSGDYLGELILCLCLSCYSDGVSPGCQVGVYATTNGGEGTPRNAFYTRWRYQPIAQQVQLDRFVPIQ